MSTVAALESDFALLMAAKTSDSSRMITWDTLQMQNDGKLSLVKKNASSDGVGQITLHNIGDGKVTVDDGTLRESPLDWVKEVTYEDPDTKAATDAALKTKGFTFDHFYGGFRVSVVLGKVFCFHVRGKTGPDDLTKTFFAVVYHSFLSGDVVLFNIPTSF